MVSHHRTIVEKDGTNYQSRYAREDHKETDANMFACQKDYIENVLHREYRPFYRVRGDDFAQAWFIALKSSKKEDKQKVRNI